MDGTRGFANPLVTSYGAPASQQVMSPTQGTPALEHGTRVLLGSTHTSGNAHSEGSGFEPLAAGRAFEDAGQHDSVHESGEASQVSTTLGGGIAHRFVPEQADTDRSGAGTQQRRGEGEALSGGVAAEDFHEGFVTPRSQGLSTIAEMVEGIPIANQFMQGIGSFFRVARTEVMHTQHARHTHDTPPRSTSLSRDSPEGHRSLGSQSSSPPTLGLHGTPASFGPPPERDGQLLSQDVLQRRLCSRGPPYFMAIPPIGPKVDQTPHLCRRRLFRQRLQGSLQGLIKGPGAGCRDP